MAPVLDSRLTNLMQSANMHSLLSLTLRNTGIRVIGPKSFEALKKLKYLDISHNKIHTVPHNTFSTLKLLRHLDISHNKMEAIADRTFLTSKQLISLDIRDNNIDSISKDMFSGLENLQTLMADHYSLCCAYFGLYPQDTGETDCPAPKDELSSCSDLLRSDFFRVCLWIFSHLAMLGNVGVLMYRLCLETQGSSSGFRVLVANLCGSDFLMGVYLMVIGSADAHFRQGRRFKILLNIRVKACW